MEYNKTFKLMEAYSKLGKLERRIIKELVEVEGFKGSVTDLARLIETDISNTRKALLHLEKIGVIFRDKKLMFILFNWLDKLANWEA